MEPDSWQSRGALALALALAAVEQLIERRGGLGAGACALPALDLLSDASQDADFLLQGAVGVLVARWFLPVLPLHGLPSVEE